MLKIWITELCVALNVVYAENMITDLCAALNVVQNYNTYQNTLYNPLIFLLWLQN